MMKGRRKMSRIRKRYIYLLLGGALLLMLSGCGDSAATTGTLNIYPHGKTSWIGDPIPFYDGKSFQIFYLDDLRDGASGYHPWSLYTTENLINYTGGGIAIPYAESPLAQDHALGTGSVIRGGDGLYHAFYTGHNDGLKQKEAIMEAVSTDLVHWTKSQGIVMAPSETYSTTDFRDPHVVYIKEKEEYWMLVTTRQNNIGIIAKFVSKDLKTWIDAGMFFRNDMGTDSNMECPTLLQFGSFWYLTFSDQSPNREVHYRIANKPEGPFTKPKEDTLDGNGFYAGKTVTDEKNLYMFGWIPTRESYDDSKPYDWGGSLAAHQLEQNKDGTLYCGAPSFIVQAMNHKQPLNVLTQSKSVKKQSNSFYFSGNGFEFIQLDGWKGSVKITGSLQTETDQGTFGICFNQGTNGEAPLNYVFSANEQKLKFCNFNTSLLQNEQANSEQPLFLQPKKEVQFTFLADDSAAVLYIEGQGALSARMFSMPGKPWGFFSQGAKLTIKNLQIAN